MRQLFLNVALSVVAALVLVAASVSGAVAPPVPARVSFCFDLAGAPAARFGLYDLRARVFHYIETRGWNCGAAPSGTEPQSEVETIGANFRSQVVESVKSWARVWFEAILGRFIK